MHMLQMILLYCTVLYCDPIWHESSHSNVATLQTVISKWLYFILKPVVKSIKKSGRRFCSQTSPLPVDLIIWLVLSCTLWRWHDNILPAVKPSFNIFWKILLSCLVCWKYYCPTLHSHSTIISTNDFLSNLLSTVGLSTVISKHVQQCRFTKFIKDRKVTTS